MQYRRGRGAEKNKKRTCLEQTFLKNPTIASPKREAAFLQRVLRNQWRRELLDRVLINRERNLKNPSSNVDKSKEDLFRAGKYKIKCCEIDGGFPANGGKGRAGQKNPCKKSKQIPLSCMQKGKSPQKRDAGHLLQID